MRRGNANFYEGRAESKGERDDLLSFHLSTSGAEKVCVPLPPLKGVRVLYVLQAAD